MTKADWSKGANYWRGDRALGGHLRIRGDRLIFEPHIFDRAMDGDTHISVVLTEVAHLSVAPRVMRVWRKRLVVIDRDGRQYFLLVNGVRSVVADLQRRIIAGGGSVTVIPAAHADLVRPELTPDDSTIMNRLYSPWLHLVGAVFWLLLLIGLLSSSRNIWGLLALTVLFAMSARWTLNGFRRRSALQGTRD